MIDSKNILWWRWARPGDGPGDEPAEQLLLPAEQGAAGRGVQLQRSLLPPPAHRGAPAQAIICQIPCPTYQPGTGARSVHRNFSIQIFFLFFENLKFFWWNWNYNFFFGSGSVEIIVHTDPHRWCKVIFINVFYFKNIALFLGFFDNVSKHGPALGHVLWEVPLLSDWLEVSNAALWLAGGNHCCSLIGWR